MGSIPLTTIFEALERLYLDTVKQGSLAFILDTASGNGRVSAPGLGFRWAVGTKWVYTHSLYIKKLQTQALR